MYLIWHHLRTLHQNTALNIIIVKLLVSRNGLNQACNSKYWEISVTSESADNTQNQCVLQASIITKPCNRPQALVQVWPHKPPAILEISCYIVIRMSVQKLHTLGHFLMCDVQSTEHTHQSPLASVWHFKLTICFIPDRAATSQYLRTVSQSQRFNSNRLNKHLSKITAQYYGPIHTPPTPNSSQIIYFFKGQLH
jgi:hypothetical protein